MRDNPLYKALKGSPEEGKPSSKRPEIQMPRLVQFDLSEVEPAAKPGDQVTVYVYGTIKYVDQGKAVVAITKVEPNEKESNSEEEKDPVMVMTQESHVP